MHAPDVAPSIFDLVILGASGACVAVVLAAVAWNFARGRPAEEAERRVRSPIATASMLAFLVLVLAPLSLRLGAVELPPFPRRASMLLGAALMAAGAFVNIAGRRVLGANWADQVTVYRDQTLVQGGAFGLVRHPLYASTIWMFLGGALVFRNVLVLLATLAVFVPAMVIRANQEERMLRSRFPEYAGYQARVGMLFPHLIPRRLRS
jgi:protein-S-isoprenylcysteine O-methyltransferase Ste14